MHFRWSESEREIFAYLCALSQIYIWKYNWMRARANTECSRKSLFQMNSHKYIPRMAGEQKLSVVKYSEEWTAAKQTDGYQLIEYRLFWHMVGRKLFKRRLLIYLKIQPVLVIGNWQSHCFSQGHLRKKSKFQFFVHCLFFSENDPCERSSVPWKKKRTNSDERDMIQWHRYYKCNFHKKTLRLFVCAWIMKPLQQACDEKPNSTKIMSSIILNLCLFSKFLNCKPNRTETLCRLSIFRSLGICAMAKAEIT